MADISSLQSVQNNHEKYAHLFENSKGNDMINTETFFNLLMAEMSNQDPLEPMSNTEFVSQMAQFTALQAQQDNLKYSSSNYASSLVGKTLTLNQQNEDGTLKSGVCSGINISGSDVKVVVDGTSYELSQIKAVADTREETPKTTIEQAMQFMDKNVMVKVLGEDGKFYYDQGTVTAVEIDTDDSAKIVINGYMYSVDEIIYVESSAEVTAPDKGTDNTETTDNQDEEETLQKLLDILES